MHGLQLTMPAGCPSPALLYSRLLTSSALVGADAITVVPLTTATQKLKPLYMSILHNTNAAFIDKFQKGYSMNEELFDLQSI